MEHTRITRWIVAPVLCVAAMLGSSIAVAAEGPDYKYTAAERDSVLAAYDNVFPIWGRKAVEKGFSLPLPAGLNLNYMFMQQDIALSKLGLSLGDDPTEEVDFIELSDALSTVHTINFRADLWVLPFLNLYGFGGSAMAETEVSVLDPVQFTSIVDQTGTYGGVGITGNMGIKGNFLIVDVNWSWTKLENLIDPVRGRVLSIRYGRRLRLPNSDALAFWVGTMNQKLKSETNGSILLSEVIPPDAGGALDDYQDSDWYMDLDAGKQLLVDRIVDRIVNGDPGSTKINYSLGKEPAQKWNMIAGANYEFSPAWQFRAEFGFIGRYSMLLNLNYRFNL